MMVGKTGVKMPRGDKKAIMKFDIPIIPIDIQKQIISEIEDLSREKENTIQSIKQNELLLESYIRSIDGEEMKLSSVFSLSSGSMLSKKNRRNGTIPVYGGNGITGYHDQYMLNKPTIVIGRVGEYCGSVHLTDGPAWVTDNALFVTNLKIEVGFKYLLYALRYLNLNQYANRTGQPNISQSAISEVKILIPNSSVQEMIESKIIKYENEIQSAKAVLSECNARKQAILDKYLK
jgi:type I restriction enzyme S subunit